MLVRTDQFCTVFPESGMVWKIPLSFTDWDSNVDCMTVQRGQNAHYVPSL